MTVKKLVNGVIILVLFVFAGISLFPFYWNLIASVTPVSEIFRYPPVLLPIYFTLEHFQRLNTFFPHFANNIFNSVFLALIIPTLALFINSMAGFAFAKYKFRGKNILFAIVIGTMLLPTTTNFIPLFLQMVAFDLVDNFLAVILPGMAGAFGVFLFRQAIFSVPNELLDAGRIDGANDFFIYLKIVLPTIKPMLTTVFIMNVITVWNDFFWPFIVLRSGPRLTFPVVLAGIQGITFDIPWGVIMVGAFILTAPTIIIYSALSKHIVPDMFSGSVKG